MSLIHIPETGSLLASPRLVPVLVLVALVAPSLALMPAAEAVPTATYSSSAIPFAPLTMSSPSSLGMGDESFTGAIGIGFNVPFFGQSESLFWVSANGFITLRGPTSSGCCEGQAIPSRDLPNEGVVAGFWTDLDPSAGGSVAFQTMSAPVGRADGAANVLVVAFTGVPLKGVPLSSQTFQIQVFNTGVIETHWTNVSAGGVRNATVGIERGDGAIGHEHERGANLTHANAAVRFTPVVEDLPAPAPFVSFVSPSAARPGQSVAVVGNSFVNGSRVFLDDVEATTSFAFSQQLSIVVPEMPADVVDVTVLNPDNQSHTLINAFQVRPPADANAPNYVLSTPGFGMLPLTAAAVDLEGVTDESVVGPLALGFTTTFFGEPVSELFVTGNGFVSFGPTHAGCCQGGEIPAANSPNGLVAGFWTDLDPQAGGSHVRMETLAAPPGRNASLVTVVAYEGVPFFPNTPEKVTFQIHVYDSGIYEVHVDQAPAAGRIFTIGIEDPAGDAGVQALRSQEALNDAAFRFTPRVAVTPPVLLSLIGPAEPRPGDTITASGANFSADARAIVRGVSALTQVADGTTLSFIVPQIPPGPASIFIRNADGGESAAITLDIFEAPPAPLTLTSVAPSIGRGGDDVTLVGTGFTNATSVAFGGVAANVRSATPTQLVARVPPGLLGFVDVAAQDPDEVAVLVNGFEVVSGPTISGVAPSAVRVGETFRMRGGAFGSAPALLVGGHPVATRVVDAGELEGTIGDLVPVGLQDVTVLTDGLSATRENALVVLPSPDLAVQSIDIERAEITTDAGAVPIDIIAGQRVVVTIANVGQETAAGGEAVLSWRPSDAIDALGRGASAPEEFARLAVPDLRPGESATLEATWREPGALGEFMVRAQTSLANDTRASNDLREVRTRVLVGGVRGVTPCDVRCDALPALSERRIDETNETSATDSHTDAVARFRIVTRSASFNFDQPDRIFDTHTTDAEGADNACTVWRFFGGRGSMMAEAAPNDGIDGLVEVLAAGASNANGSRTSTTTTRSFLLGVEVDAVSSNESEPVTSARSSYDVTELVRVRVEAEELRGDFARCTRTLGASVTETFTFAALPGDLEQLPPSTSGSGTARHLTVKYLERSTSSTSERSTLTLPEAFS